MKYHISPKTGRPNICRANTKPCPIEGDHYETSDAAKAANEAKLASEHGSGIEGVRKTPALSPDDEALVVKYGEAYRNDGEESVRNVVESGRRALHSLRELEKQLGGFVLTTNGGAYHRFKAAGQPWTIELQAGADGELHARIFDAGVPVYGDHSRNKAWRIPVQQTSAHLDSTVRALYEGFIGQPENQKPTPMWG